MKIAILGAGEMGSMLAMGLKNQHEVTLFGPRKEKVRLQAEKIGVFAEEDLSRLLSRVEVVVLAMKAKHLREVHVAQEINRHLKSSQHVLSIMGGIRIEELQRLLPSALGRISCGMPNVSVAFGMGQIVLLDSEHRKFWESALGCCGQVIFIPESLMPGATSLLGTGPCYSALIIESMMDAAIAMGIPREEARAWTLNMLEGTINLMRQSELSPSEIKNRVTSPGGITIKGVLAFEEHAIRAGLMKTFLAAYTPVVS